MGNFVAAILEGRADPVEGLLYGRIRQADQDNPQLTPFSRIHFHFNGQRIYSPQRAGMDRC
jgi:hypothetical protein